MFFTFCNSFIKCAIVEKPDIFVPLYRDENVKWAVEHKKNTEAYRQKLGFIYQEIYCYSVMDVQEA